MKATTTFRETLIVRSNVKYVRVANVLKHEESPNFTCDISSSRFQASSLKRNQHSQNDGSKKKMVGVQSPFNSIRRDNDHFQGIVLLTLKLLSTNTLTEQIRRTIKARKISQLDLNLNTSRWFSKFSFIKKHILLIYAFLRVPVSRLFQQKYDESVIIYRWIIWEDGRAKYSSIGLKQQFIAQMPRLVDPKGNAQSRHDDFTNATPKLWQLRILYPPTLQSPLCLGI